jgi:hypothetical protein
MALIVILPLGLGVLWSWRRWHVVERNCLLQQAKWRAFYGHGYMVEEVEALAHEMGR